jgi:NAD(P)-dependent dehydrogenase (short-subunit alcohol dehydrogenase family)
MPFQAKDLPDQSGKHIVITGATSGIGLEAAVVLASLGATLTITGRTQARAEAAAATIRARAGGKAEVAALGADMERLMAVRGLAQAITARNKPVDVLINNAGTLGPKQRAITADGFELMFGVNFLAPFALTALVWPALLLAGAPRVVTIASNAHKRGKIDFGDLQSSKGYVPMRAYSQSKLADLMFALALDRRLRASGSKVASIAAHPGLAMTSIIEKAKIPFTALLKVTVGRIIGHSSASGALPTVFAAASPGAVSGGYYGPQGRMEMKGQVGDAAVLPHARDQAVAARLWETAESMTGIAFPAL